MQPLLCIFAKTLYQHNGVAIGILNNALGGLSVEAWMSEGDAPTDFS